MISSIQSLQQGGRGVLLVVTIALCSGFLAEHYAAPAMLFALLIGMAFHFLVDNEQCRVGIEFSARHLLRVGVALLGFRLSLNDVVAQGWEPIAMIIGLVVLTILSGLVIAPLLKLNTQLGLLTGGAVAICGASAALAIAAAMPFRERIEEDTLFTVIAVTTLSTLAMIIYPLAFSALDFDESQIGFLLGATIHDVAQVVAAGYTMSDTAGDVATITKLQRILLLPIVVLVLSFVFRGESNSQFRIPPFILAFAVFVLINSTGVVPDIVVGALVDSSRWLLIIAIAALGVKTSVEAMLGLGERHIILVSLQTLFLLAAGILAVYSFT